MLKQKYKKICSIEVVLWLNFNLKLHCCNLQQTSYKQNKGSLQERNNVFIIYSVQLFYKWGTDSSASTIV
ncbi:hypothetical protein Leryth_006452 [Lithospermum erythrorhizon]|nr:hypothetical protein Leryth_006452 [Lithospermum erythrorhizon]